MSALEFRSCEIGRGRRRTPPLKLADERAAIGWTWASSQILHTCPGDGPQPKDGLPQLGLQLAWLCRYSISTLYSHFLPFPLLPSREAARVWAVPSRVLRRRRSSPATLSPVGNRCIFPHDGLGLVRSVSPSFPRLISLCLPCS